MNPDLEITNNNGLTPLHLAVKAAQDIQTIRAVRQLLVKGSNRDAESENGLKPVQMIKENLDEEQKNELERILSEPVYLECLMSRVPLKPIRPSHKTQFLFMIFFLAITLSQFFIVIPCK